MRGKKKGPFKLGPRASTLRPPPSYLGPTSRPAGRTVTTIAGADFLAHQSRKPVCFSVPETLPPFPSMVCTGPLPQFPCRETEGNTARILPQLSESEGEKNPKNVLVEKRSLLL